MKAINCNVKKICVIGLLSAAALMLSYIEFLLPFSVGIPGIKLGLSNIAVIFALYKLGISDSVSVAIIKVSLSALLFSGPAQFIYSLSGMVLSLAAMIAFRKTNKFGIVTVSIIGAVFHNLGQIICAYFVLENTYLLSYIPILIIAGIVTGALTGSVCLKLKDIIRI